MRISGLDAAGQFAKDKFPESEVIFLGGSASRGEETASSDLDIVVVDYAIEASCRKSFMLYGWKIETFIHNEKSYQAQFDQDKDSGRPILARMLAEGIVIRDNGDAGDIKEKANDFINIGPNPLSREFINASRYFIFDLLDDFVDSKNHQEALITLNTLALQFADFVLRFNGQWSGRGKGLVRAMKKFDEGLHDDFFRALDRYYENRDKKPIVELVNDFYEPLGGALFDGFEQGK